MTQSALAAAADDPLSSSQHWSKPLCYFFTLLLFLFFMLVFSTTSLPLYSSFPLYASTRRAAGATTVAPSQLTENNKPVNTPKTTHSDGPILSTKPAPRNTPIETMGSDGIPNFYNDPSSTYNCRDRYKSPGSNPRFMVLGVHKGGSTALYSYLTKHGRIRPAVCKEIHFFDDDREYSKGKQHYLRHFIDLAKYKGAVITGEGSPKYIRDPAVPQRVYDMFAGTPRTEMRFLVTLREPSTRYESHWVGARERGQFKYGCERTWDENLADLEACYAGSETRTQCEARMAENPIVRGLYASQLERWLRYFNSSQFLILQAEAMFHHKNDTLQRAVEFLEMRPYTAEELESFKDAKEGSSHMSSETAQRCSAALKQRMDAFYAPHNTRLKHLLEEHFPQALKHWEPTWSGWIK